MEWAIEDNRDGKPEWLKVLPIGAKLKVSGTVAPFYAGNYRDLQLTPCEPYEAFYVGYGFRYTGAIDSWYEDSFLSKPVKLTQFVPKRAVLVVYTRVVPNRKEKWHTLSQVEVLNV